MKKNVIILFLYFICLNTFGQNTKEQTTFFMSSKNGITYIDNANGSYFTLELPGDSLKETQVSNAYLVDNNFFQIMKFEYSPKQYSNISDTLKEIELLKFYRENEVEYLEKEVYKQKIEVSEEVFKNKEGKRFYLWYYAMPNIKDISDTIILEDESVPIHQLYLSFVCNQYVCGLYTPVIAGEILKDKINIIKKIAESIDIYGYKIDLNTLYYKLEVQKEGEELQYTDTLRRFEFDVPNWLNIIESESKNYWIATMPDIDNIKNAVLVQSFDKSEFKSFKKFNKEKILDKKIGDTSNGSTWMLKKELPTPKNSNGICYKVNMMKGRVMYHCQYLTFEASTAYLIVSFTATENTYERNLPKFQKFVEGIRLQD